MEGGELCTIACQSLVEDTETKEISVIWIGGTLVIESKELAVRIASAQGLALRWAGWMRGVVNDSSGQHAPLHEKVETPAWP